RELRIQLVSYLRNDLPARGQLRVGRCPLVRRLLRDHGLAPEKRKVLKRIARLKLGRGLVHGVLAVGPEQRPGRKRDRDQSDQAATPPDHLYVVLKRRVPGSLGGVRGGDRAHGTGDRASRGLARAARGHDRERSPAARQVRAHAWLARG